jgi:hypothetical protein
LQKLATREETISWMEKVIEAKLSIYNFRKETFQFNNPR